MVSASFKIMAEDSDLGALPLSAAQQSYLEALRAISRGAEEETGMHLNECRRQLLGSRHWTEMSDADTQAIAPNLTCERFYRLYGDTISTPSRRSEEEIKQAQSVEQSLWIRSQSMIALVAGHISALGTPEDSQNFAAYVLRHAHDIQPEAPRLRR